MTDLPVRIGRLTWTEWARATIFTMVVLAMILTAIVIICGANGNGATRLVRLLTQW